MSRKEAGVTERVGHAEGEKQQDIKGVCSPVQLPPSASAALYTESFHVQVPESSTGEPDPQRALTASGLWKGDTINSLSPSGFFMLVMWLWMSVPPLPHPHSFTTQSNFEHILTKYN